MTHRQHRTVHSGDRDRQHRGRPTTGITSWDLAWATGVLEESPEVDLHGLTLTAEPMWFFDPIRCVSEPVPIATLAIMVADVRSALLLVDLLTLRQTGTIVLHEESGISTTRTWAGWSSEASSDIAVRVEITASERTWPWGGTAHETPARSHDGC